mgnify:FL=1
MNKQNNIKFGQKGAEVKWRNYRAQLIEDLSKLVDKKRLNFYMEYSKYDYSGRLLREALMFHRKQNKLK